MFRWYNSWDGNDCHRFQNRQSMASVLQPKDMTHTTIFSVHRCANPAYHIFTPANTFWQCSTLCTSRNSLFSLCTVWTSTNEYRVGDLFVRWWRNGTLDRGTHFVHFVRCEVLDLWCTLLQLLHYSFLLVVFSLRPLETRFPHLLGSLRLQPALVHLRTLLSSLHSLHFEVLTWPPDNNKSFIFLSLWISACEHHTLRSHLLLSLYFYVWSPPNYKTHASSTLYIDMPFAPIQNQVSFQSLEPLYALV